MHFGDGMRAWAESRYEDALTHLYRAYALKPSARTLRMIVLSHDFLGDCEAAHTQRVLHREEYASAPAPKLQRCSDPAVLTLQCEDSSAEIFVNDRKPAHCGRSLRLPAGEHRVRAPEFDFDKTVALNPGERMAMAIETRPEKWRANNVRAHRATLVPRLVGADSFVVYMSGDGIYRVWMRDDMELLPPYDGEICRQRVDGDSECTPMTEEQTMRLRNLVPMLED